VVVVVVGVEVVVVVVVGVVVVVVVEVGVEVEVEVEVGVEVVVVVGVEVEVVVVVGVEVVMTHAELVQRAAKWLRSKGYTTFTEFSTKAGEIPDAIGFKGHFSIVIECKSNYSDFRGDIKKIFRRVLRQGMGGQRFFMVPTGLVALNEIPAYWGLLEVGKTVRVTKKSKWISERNIFAEQDFLVSMVRRAEIRVEAGNLAPSLDRWLKYDNRPPRR
jgi:hypothetical protein